MTELDRISLELTSRCSKACWFCYNASGPEMAARWDARDVIAFVTDCARNRIKAVSFGGGEPLEYPELFEVLGALRGLIFRSFTTNGLALDAMMETVVASAPDKVHVSIHFPGNEVEVARVIRQVRALDDAGVASGINLLVRASQLADATSCAAQIRAAGIGNDRIVYLPMRGSDTPTPDDLGRVAGSARFQSMSCLMACARSPSFVAIGADRHVAWCSYTRSRRPLEQPTYAALAAALAGLDLAYCAAPRVARRLPIAGLL